MPELLLRKRFGPVPHTSQPAAGQRDPATFVHRQLTGNAPVELQEELFRRAARLPGITTGDSRISVPGARAFFLSAAARAGPPQAFMVDGEFAHLHPAADGSLHLGLPSQAYDMVLSADWGEPHPLVRTMLVYGPRTAAELEVVWRVFLASYAFAAGQP